MGDALVLPVSRRGETGDFKLVGKRKKARKSAALADYEWQEVVRFTKTLLPTVLFFPNFLFEFPDKIYLDDVEGERDGRHETYRNILQDVLDAIGEGLDLQRHVLARLVSGSGHDKQALDNTLLKMGRNISATVLKSWNQIFKRDFGSKEIIVDCDREDDTGRWYLQLRLRDVNELYRISERSLGFRWFFAFCLLTQYRGFRKNAPKTYYSCSMNLHLTSIQLRRRAYYTVLPIFPITAP